MDNHISADLEERVVQVMGSEIPELNSQRFRRYVANLKLKDRELAAELKKAFESPTPLVTEDDPLEAERRRVAFREGLRDTWTRIFQQENLSGDKVPRRKRWVAAGVVLFALALAATVLLYRSKPVKDLNVNAAGGLASVIAPPVQTTRVADPDLLPPNTGGTAQTGVGYTQGQSATLGNAAAQPNTSGSSGNIQSFTNRGSAGTPSSFTPTPQVEPIRPEPIRYTPQRVVVQTPTSLAPRTTLSPTPPRGLAGEKTPSSKPPAQPSPVLSAMGVPGESSERLPLVAMSSGGQAPGLLASELPSISFSSNNMPVAATSLRAESPTSGKTTSRSETVVVGESANATATPSQSPQADRGGIQTGEESRDEPLVAFPLDDSPPLIVTSEKDDVFASTVAVSGQGETRAEEDQRDPLKSESPVSRTPVAISREVSAPVAQSPQPPQPEADMGVGASRTTSFGIQAERSGPGEGPVVVMRVKPATAPPGPSAPDKGATIPPNSPVKSGTSSNTTNALPVNPQNLPQSYTSPTLPPVTGPSAQSKPSLASPYTLGQRLEGKLGYDIVLAEGMGGFQVVVETSDGMLWKGTAALDATRRVSIHFSEAFGGVGGLFAVQAMALDTSDVPGLSPTYEDQAPSLASDMVRASINALSTFTQNLANASSTTVLPGGGVSQQRQAPPLGWTVLGEVSKLFALPTDKSFVRIAKVPKGTPLVILYGVGGQGVPR